MSHEYTPAQLSRYWSRVDKSNLGGCWPYQTGSVKGYGRLAFGQRTEQSHHVAYYLAHGVWPDRKVLRSCQTSSCVNPEHLYLELTAEERFWQSVSVGGDDTCWEWQAGRNEDGYGYLRWHGHKTEKAHRVAWILRFGEIPDDIEVCHQCDNPPCCNPHHLFLGTHTDNIRDMVAKGRLVTPRGEQHGEAKFSDAEIIEMRSKHQAGWKPQDIAKQYGVSQGYIYYILKERNRRS